jgi:pilus assembly protein CpaB
MARIRLFAVLAIALSAGGALAYGTYNYLKNVPVKTVTMPTQPVVVAATDLQLGEVVEAGDMSVLQWPADSVPEGAFGQESEVLGRGLIAPVVRNEPLLNAKLAPRDSGAGLPPVIPKGLRAVSVRVNEVIGVAGYVLPGTRVDVLATGMPTENRADTTTKLVLANVQVLTAGTKLEQKEDKASPMQVTVVTLLVSPEQAERLALASTEGKIQLALRNPLDQESPETPGIQPGPLLGLNAARSTRAAGRTAAPRTARATVSAAVPMAVPEPVVEIIRGDKRANEVVR